MFVRVIALAATLIGCRTDPVSPPVPAPVPVPVPALRADAAPEKPPLTVEGEPLTWTDTKRYPSPSAVCADFLAQLKKSKPPPAYLNPTKPSCKPAKLGFTFAPTATVKSVHGVAFDSGTQDWSSLIVELDTPARRGFFLTPIAWDYFDPDASQHPPHPGSLEGVTIENGKLVAIVGREEGFSVPGAPSPTQRPDGGWDVTGHELRLARGVIVCDVAATAPSCAGYFPAAAKPFLGLKSQPWPVPWPGRAWSALAWDGPMPAYEIAKGTLALKR